MPRKPSVWPRKGTPWWYTTLNGKQVRLSTDRKEAERLFHELQARKRQEDPGPEPTPVRGMSFRRLADEYLKATRDDKSPRVFGEQVSCLKKFCAHLKKTPAAEVRPHMVTAWMAPTTWSRSTRATRRKLIKAVFNWGVKEGHLGESPLGKMPGGGSSRRDRVLTDDEKRKIAECVSPEFRDFLRAIELTGARPFSEIARVTAADVDFDSGTITLQKHKNRKKTGKPRVIFLVPELVRLLKKRAKRYPSGYLFRSQRNTPWHAVSARRWFVQVEKKLGIKAWPYCYRHLYVTAALEKGVPVEVVAEMVGNSPAVIHKHYSHVGRDQSVFKSAIAKIAKRN